MDFSFVSPHPVSAARLQVACATDRYKMFSHRAQRSLAAERRGQAGCMAGTCMGKGTAAQGHLAVCHTEGCAAPAQPACPGRSPATTHSAPLRTHTGCSHTGEPTASKAPQTIPQTVLSQHSPKEPGSRFALEKAPALLQPISHPITALFVLGFFFPPLFPPSFKGSS